MRISEDRLNIAPIPLWLDCDPGNDDAFAILLACFSPYIDLLGISTVFGNVLLVKTSHNALAILDVLKFKQDEIKVYTGSSKPLVIDPVNAEEVHGENGIGGATLPEEPKIQASTDYDYLEAMKAAIMSHTSKVSIVCTGALTNFAKLVQKYPEVCERIRYVSIMGGAIHAGNISPYAEFNIFCDPHAAAVIMDEPRLQNKIILTPLNITHTVLASPKVRNAIRGCEPSIIRETFTGILDFYFDYYHKYYPNAVGPPVHDPVAVFSLLAKVAQEEPQMESLATSCDYHFLQRRVKVVTSGNNVGETIIQGGDMDPMKKEDGVFIGMSINAPFFWENMIDAFRVADAQVKDRQLQ